MQNTIPNSSPMDVSNYAQIDPSDVTQQNQNYPGLVLKQIERINYLLIMGTQQLASATGIARIQTVPELGESIYRGLRSIETMLSPFLTNENYYTKAKELKQKIKNSDITTDPDETFEALGKWYDLLIQNLKHLDLIPQKTIDIDFSLNEETEKKE